MNVEVHMKDKAEFRDNSSLSDSLIARVSGAPKRTKITIRNAETGEILQERENKVVITGGQLNAMYAWGLDSSVKFPTYNEVMKLDGSDSGIEPKNNPIICLFGVSDSGCGTTPKDIYVAKYTDRIKPAPADATSAEDFNSTMLMPFRWVDSTNDISEDLRKYYFGRKTYDRLGKIGYYLKTFDTDPVLHLAYADGTPITDTMYDIASDQVAECYVETRLRITRLDFRDYFEDVLGWDKARISSLSLFYAWYDDDIDQYRYYQDILPYSVLYYSYISLTATNIALDISYDVYY